MKDDLIELELTKKEAQILYDLVRVEIRSNKLKTDNNLMLLIFKLGISKRRR